MTREMEAGDMCDYSRYVKSEGLLMSIRKLIKNAGMTPEQAMEVLEIPEKEMQAYVQKLDEYSASKI